MKKCYCNFSILVKTGPPQPLCQIISEFLKLDPAGFSLKKTDFFRLFKTFLAKLFHLDCKEETWSGKTEKKLNLGRSRAVGAKIELWAKQWAPQDFFFNFLSRTNENKICSSAKKVFSKKCIFGRFTANWLFRLLLHLFFLVIKNKCSWNKSNSFLQKNHLLLYGQVKKIPFRPI